MGAASDEQKTANDFFWIGSSQHGKVMVLNNFIKLLLIPARIKRRVRDSGEHPAGLLAE
jgi:hypothetical protein